MVDRQLIAKGRRGEVYSVSNRQNLVAKLFSQYGLSEIASQAEFPKEFSQYEKTKKFQSRVDYFIQNMTKIAKEINSTVEQDLAKEFWPKNQNLPIFCIGPEEYNGANSSKNLVFYKYVVKDENMTSKQKKKILNIIANTDSPGCNSLLPFLVFLFNLSCAHKNGYYHRDIHIGNIICKDNYIYLIDLDGMLSKSKFQYQGLLDFRDSISMIFYNILDFSKQYDLHDVDELLQKILYIQLEIMLMFFFLESGKFLSPQKATNFILLFERNIIFKLAAYYLNYIDEQVKHYITDEIISKQLKKTFSITLKFKEFLSPYKQFMSKCNFFKNFIRVTNFQQDIKMYKNHVKHNLYDEIKYYSFSAARYNQEVYFKFSSQEISGKQFFYIVSIFDKSYDITSYTKLSTINIDIYIDAKDFQKLKSRVKDPELLSILNTK